MSIDVARLSEAIFLATGESATGGEVERLAVMLDVVEEALPYLLLRRGGFSGCPQMQAALEASRGRAVGPAKTRREPSLADSVRAEAAERELAAALKALIEADLAGADLQARVDDAMRVAAELNANAAFGPQHSIQR
jgi:hypothetical protein